MWDGYYAHFGEALRAEVAEQDIELQLVSTAGWMENIRLLLDGEIDVGLVESLQRFAPSATRVGSGVEFRRAFPAFL